MGMTLTLKAIRAELKKRGHTARLEKSWTLLLLLWR
jgi:hypothetical protein